jgi:hypothetical protein
VETLCPYRRHGGIQADVCFIQLESEPTPQSLDRVGRAIVGAVLVWAALGETASSLSLGWPFEVAVPKPGGAIDHAGLRLITCGGTYDAARNRYLDNVIVFDKLKAVHGP